MSLPPSAGPDRPTAVVASVLLAILAILAWPSPPRAEANVACDVGTAPVGVVAGAVGLGNPAGDLCDKVTGAVTKPVTDAVSGALKDAASGVFGQLTTWVSEGAGWLMGRVVRSIEESTTPQLDTEGFLQTYGKMAAIAAVMACAMLLLAILEGIAQGSPGLLARVVFLNVPVAFLGTSIAFAVVQLLLGVTDELSAAVTNASQHGSTHFFEAAIHDLGHVGGEAGKKVAPEGTPGSLQGDVASHVAVPLFVGFLAAILGALAAFCVWIELAFRDAAVYVVAVFMPLSLAASIWPRWNGVLRKSCEILVALIGSKFVIVVIVALAAGLIAENSTSTEHVLAAGVLMLLACFSPLVLFRLIPFSEGAMASAMERRSVPGTAGGAVAFASNVQMLHHMRGSGSGPGQGVSLWGPSGGEPGGSSSGSDAGGPAGRGPRSGDPGSGGQVAGGSAGAGKTAAAGGAGAVPAVAAHGAKAAAGRASDTAREGSSAAAGTGSHPEEPDGSRTQGAGAPRPAPDDGGSAGPSTPAEDGSGPRAARPSSPDPESGAGTPSGGASGGGPGPRRPAPGNGPPEPGADRTGGTAGPPAPSPRVGEGAPRPAPDRPRPEGGTGEKGAGS